MNICGRRVRSTRITEEANSRPSLSSSTSSIAARPVAPGVQIREPNDSLVSPKRGKIVWLSDPYPEWEVAVITAVQLPLPDHGAASSQLSRRFRDKVHGEAVHSTSGCDGDVGLPDERRHHDNGGLFR